MHQIVADLTENYLRHSEVDGVGLWQIGDRVAHMLRTTDKQAIMNVSLQIIRNLIDAATGFRPWPRSPDELLARIRAEWADLPFVPTLMDPICWLQPPHATA